MSQWLNVLSIKVSLGVYSINTIGMRLKYFPLASFAAL